ncbi:uncharacterized protein LOC103711252 [Phoenix dactylifera]|uniref:Uncharacterized protein LOC103711252 n=1 Tax=Phoenix dactylifera TaxID=42345 RepID=A0A8B7CBC1_PHODC|nr:uncharacterized protein LOC103711252 [Phoenix dactylifera]
MVSLQAALSSEEKEYSNLENPLSMKRKREYSEESDDNFFAKEFKSSKAEDVDLHLDSPLPLEWERCLDIKSGQIHFYNTRTHRRTYRDPRESTEPPASCPSLDLELNLTFEPPRSHISGEERIKQDCNSRDNSGSLSRSLTSLETEQQEMVAAVCMRCHMLVMMSKATPSCPNCKFVHPPSYSSSRSLKPGFKLLCCKD